MTLREKIQAIDPRVRRIVEYGGIVILLAIAFQVLYYYKVVGILNTAKLTPLCNVTYQSDIRYSYGTFTYALNQSHWTNLTAYMNASCLSYQMYVINATTDQKLLHPG